MSKLPFYNDPKFWGEVEALLGYIGGVILLALLLFSVPFAFMVGGVIVGAIWTILVVTFIIGGLAYIGYKM